MLRHGFIEQDSKVEKYHRKPHADTRRRTWNSKSKRSIFIFKVGNDNQWQFDLNHGNQRLLVIEIICSKGLKAKLLNDWTLGKTYFFYETQDSLLALVKVTLEGERGHFISSYNRSQMTNELCQYLAASKTNPVAAVDFCRPWIEWTINTAISFRSWRNDASAWDPCREFQVSFRRVWSLINNSTTPAVIILRQDHR